MKIEVGNGMNIDYKISTLSTVAIYSLQSLISIIYLHCLEYCQGAGWWQAAKFEIIQLKTTARAERAPAAAAAPPTHRQWNKNELDAAIGISYNYTAG